MSGYIYSFGLGDALVIYRYARMKGKKTGDSVETEIEAYAMKYPMRVKAFPSNQQGANKLAEYIKRTREIRENED